MNVEVGQTFDLNAFYFQWIDWYFYFLLYLKHG